MTTDLSFSLDSKMQLDLPSSVLAMHSDAPRAKSLEDVAGAVAAALADPLEFPPLLETAAPEDQIVLAVGEGVPQVEIVVGSVIKTLIDGGRSPEDVTLLISDAGPNAFTNRAAQLPAEFDDVRRLVHDPRDRSELAFLNRTDDQNPIFLNKALVDADVVISIGCLRTEDTPGYNGPGGVLCPTFSDEESQQRFREFHATVIPLQHAARARAKAREAIWLLGSQFTLQVIPGRNGQILDVLAGDIEAVAAKGSDLYEAAWQIKVERSASLVITAVDGGREQQTWENVCQAIAAATNVTEPGGAIAVCCDLESPPGAGLQRLAGGDDAEDLLEAMRKQPPPDAVAAVQLARALEEFSVYLLSRLDSSTFERLGLVAISGKKELTRLAEGRESCLFVSGGQFARLALAGTAAYLD